MTDALEDHEGTVSIGGRTITNLRFADDIDGLAGKEQELVNLVKHLNEASAAYNMQINAEKTKLMTNNPNGISTEIKINNKKLETVNSFKYLGAIVSDEGSKPEILSRIAQTIAAMTKLKVIWNDSNIAIGSKIRLMRSLVMSIFLYACESWTLTADIDRRIQAVEMRCFRRLLGISYRDHITDVEVKARIESAIGSYEDLLSSVKKRKLNWYGHVTRSSGLAHIILQGTVQGSRRRGRQRKRWEDNIREWTGLELSDTVRKAENREEWNKLVAKSSVVPLRSKRLRDKFWTFVTFRELLGDFTLRKVARTSPPSVSRCLSSTTRLPIVQPIDWAIIFISSNCAVGLNSFIILPSGTSRVGLSGLHSHANPTVNVKH
ncbi:unnamed protein product [Leuciscus chuanchicus]